MRCVVQAADRRIHRLSPSEQVMNIRFDGQRALVTGAGRGNNIATLHNRVT